MLQHLQLLSVLNVDHGEPGSAHGALKDAVDLYQGIAKGQLPAVSFVKPSGWTDGHPASSKLNLFEGFVKKIVDLVKGKPDLSKDTAILVTFDEAAVTGTPATCKRHRLDLKEELAL